jgi:hypothetical protein
MGADKQIAICYNAGTPRTWADVIGPVRDLTDAAEMLQQWARQVFYDGKHGGAGWDTDQRLLFDFVGRFEPSRVHLLTDRQLGFARLDRDRIGARLMPIQRILASRRYYADYHMKRPHVQFSELNQEVASLVRQGSRKSSPIEGVLHGLERRIARTFGV